MCNIQIHSFDITSQCAGYGFIYFFPGRDRKIKTVEGEMEKIEKNKQFGTDIL